MINMDRGCFQYTSGDLVYIISPLTSPFKTSMKVTSRYIRSLVMYKIIDLHNYLLTT